MGRAAAVGIPVWLVLLFLLPFTGLGALACLTIATFLSFGVVAWADRRHEQFVTRSLNDLKDALAASEDGTRPEVDVRVYRGAHDKRYVQND